MQIAQRGILKRRLEKLWRGIPAIQQRLGCSLQAEQSRKIAEQRFEHGSMLWVKSQRDGDGTIYVFFGDAGQSTQTWQSFIDMSYAVAHVSGRMRPRKHGTRRFTVCVFPRYARKNAHK